MFYLNTFKCMLNLYNGCSFHDSQIHRFKKVVLRVLSELEKKIYFYILRKSNGFVLFMRFCLLK